MGEHEKIINRIKDLLNTCGQWPTVVQFDFITNHLLQEGFPIDQAATQAVRKSAPNTIMVVKIEGELDYVKMDRTGDIEIYGYFDADCDTQVRCPTAKAGGLQKP
jgi:hypothetical protein